MDILDDSTTQKPEISYPTRWGFTIIGRDKDVLHNCIKEVLQSKEHLCSYGKSSKNGKFQSYYASCIVQSQEERDALFGAFSSYEGVDVVL
ncbi:MAG TPA: DUF493 domain-containing protein [Epsilonproteobacteria bacterium]|nr:DUF493 domain-containing protein [Campylobacterota bacterium]